MSLYIWPETVVFIDACVLYKAQLRDIVLQLAVDKTFSLRWSEKVQEEWTSRLVRNRPELADLTSRTVALMNLHLPDGLVGWVSDDRHDFVLPDPNDHHVLAAAIQCNTNVLLTDNLRDFPADILQECGIQACSSDKFLSRLCELQPMRIQDSLDRVIDRLRHPKMLLSEYCERLIRVGCPETAENLEKLYSSRT